jgi:hypothetical protein
MCLSSGTGKGGHFGRLSAIGTISHDRIGAGNGNVGNGKAIDVNAQCTEIGGNKTSAQPRGGKRRSLIRVV